MIDNWTSPVGSRAPPALPSEKIFRVTFSQELPEPHHADPMGLPGLFDVVRGDHDGRSGRRTSVHTVASVS